MARAQDAVGDGHDIRASASSQRDAVSAALGNYLLRGYCMLAEECDTCGTILLRDRQKQLYCVYCDEVAHTTTPPQRGAASTASAAADNSAQSAGVSTASSAAEVPPAVSPAATQPMPLSAAADETGHGAFSASPTPMSADQSPVGSARFSMRTPGAAPSPQQHVLNPDSVARRMLLNSPQTQNAQLSDEMRARLEGSAPSTVISTGLDTDQPITMPSADDAAGVSGFAASQVYGGGTSVYTRSTAAGPIGGLQQPPFAMDQLPALMEQTRLLQQQQQQQTYAAAYLQQHNQQQRVTQAATQAATQERDAQQAAVVLQVRYSAQIAVQMLNTKLQQASQLLANTPTVNETMELCNLMNACATAIYSLKQLL